MSRNEQKARIKNGKQPSHPSENQKLDFHLEGLGSSKDAQESPTSYEVHAAKKMVNTELGLPNCIECSIADFLDLSLRELRALIQINAGVGTQDLVRYLDTLKIRHEKVIWYGNYKDFARFLGSADKGQYFLGWTRHILRGERNTGGIIYLWDPQNSTPYPLPIPNNNLYFSLRAYKK
ncbi:MAG: hypothetical protein LUQ11_00135 [Methylococcaceae bacterium]|nr:hypothetical protein [Methylococcaceae bacterium]